MRLGIAGKLFLAVLATNVLVVLAMGIVSRVSFAQGFVGYLNEQGIARMEAVLPRLAAAYGREGSWEFLRDEPRRWFHLLHPPAREDGKDRPRQPPPLSALTGIDLRLALLDAQHAHVTGHPLASRDAIDRPVVWDGQTVGYMAMIPFESVTEPADLRFQAQQLTATWAIGIAAVALAALVGFALSRMVVAPLARIADATHRLARGDHAVSLPVTSGDEIGRLSRDFNRLAQVLEQNETARRAYMADISHELRTPLGILRGELEALEDGVRAWTDESRASLQAEVTRLGKLVDDVHELALSESGALRFSMQTIDAVPVLDRMLEEQAPRFEAAGIQVTREAGPAEARLRGDEQRLELLFRNLLENTLRYTDRGGRLVVATALQADRFVVDLQDSAPGVPDAVRVRLFERFYRAEPSRSRAHGGSGLGLAICRTIVAAHDGDIEALPSPLGGIRIRVTLPLEVSA